MKLKWKIPLLFFLLSLILFFVIVFYLRLDVIEQIWERVYSQRKEYLAHEKRIADQLARFYPNQTAMKDYLERASRGEGISLRLYDQGAVRILASARTPVKGKSTDLRWYPVRDEGKTVAFIRVERPVTEKDVGLGQALTDTLTFLLVFLAGLLILLALYFNTSITRPLTRLNRRLDEVRPGRSLSPLTGRGRCDEIGELYRRFGEMEERLHRAHREQVDMVAAIAHDLKTPLTSINGFLELLITQQSRGGEERGEYLQLARRKAESMTQLVKAFSDFTRNEGMLPQVELLPVQVSEFFESVAKEYEAELAGLGYQFQWSHSFGRKLRIRLYEPMIRRVFANLISNAVRYGGRKDLMVVMVGGSEKDRVWIRIEDNGVGVPENDLPHLFQPFFTGDPSRRYERGGTGLGLAVCRSIMDRHGGEIYAYQVKSGGLGVHFTLPLDPGE
ncbi:HAMP domain-containing sensor histidine kinase [Salinithrix halophila]|uniref:histidine kinase n=1 Tax=Salinithrix halophila TaxID=1485204 RepID=A0ABV8JGY7_9BACL